MDDDTMNKLGSEIVKKVAQVEELGQTIVGTQAAIVHMDQQRAKLQEALHAVKRTDDADKTFTAISSNFLIQYPNAFLKKVIKDDVNKLDSLIDEHREEIKQNINQLKRFEGEKDLNDLGFDLKSYQDRINE